ncbi:MAG: hypothetical protein HY796_04365 [Elusimicrobia bacterium]|nr:hypothetical protein [Elusimicrobiota bacterium]
MTHVMKIFTDSPAFAEKIIGPAPGRPPQGADRDNPCDTHDNIRVLADRLLRGSETARQLDRSGGPAAQPCEIDFHPLWKHLLIAERSPRSQFDELISFIRERPGLSGGILALAGSGTGFHGSEGRPWICGEGNLHLCAFLAPEPPAPHRASAYMVLSVVSVLQTLDSLGFGGRAAVKWVNDILIEDAKVGGALVHTQNLGASINGVVLGFGLNVETAPAVPRDRFVPRVGSLAEFAKDKTACPPGTQPTPVGVFGRRACSLGPVFRRLSAVLADNYQKLLAGGYRELHEIYAARSVVLGRAVAVYDGDRELCRGKAVSIGENLELFLEGAGQPVTGGRLALL